MKLDTLYKRTKTGKIQFWDISTYEDINNTWLINKVSGQLGTNNPNNYYETVKEGKNIGKSNETTIQEQAINQVQSEWNKKRDEGYKSLNDVYLSSHTIFFDSPTDNQLKEFLELHLPQFNTDASGNTKPMKAPQTSWKLGTKLNWPQLIEPKLDGLRATLVIEGTELKPKVKFLSSSGKEYKALKHLTDTFFVLYKGKVPCILDGEIYCHGMTLEEINSAAKKLGPETLKLKYHIFDNLNYSSDKQSIRTEKVYEIIQELNHIFFPKLESRLIHSEDEIIPLHDIWVEQGYEGAMLKDPNGTYQFGQRSSYWRKVKMFDDDEFIVIDYELGQRGVQDLSFICKCEAGIFKVPMNGTIDSKEKLYKKIKSLIGKKLTVKHFKFTKYGIPNLPKGKAFRDD